MWSETGFFETAMFDASQWKARFISSEDINAGKSSKGMLHRHEFMLDGEIAFARVYATALGVYELSINGSRAGDAVFTPGWTDYRKRLNTRPTTSKVCSKRELMPLGRPSAADGTKATKLGWGGSICDKRILKEQYGSMKKWIEYIRTHAQDGVLWNTGYHFGDWLSLDTKEGDRSGGTPHDLIATAFYAYSTGLLAKSAAV